MRYLYSRLVRYYYFNSGQLHNIELSCMTDIEFRSSTIAVLTKYAQDNFKSARAVAENFKFWNVDDEK